MKLWIISFYTFNGSLSRLTNQIFPCSLRQIHSNEETIKNGLGLLTKFSHRIFPKQSQRQHFKVRSSSKMMDFEMRAKKIQKEADSRILEAKRRKERDLKLQREHKQREIQRMEIAEQNRLKLLAIEEERQEQERLFYAKTGGIRFQLENLIPYEIKDSEDDKIILPENALASLDQQNALESSSGPLIFEISNININGNVTSTTHCGIREFSAKEGFIGLPPKVIQSLLKRSLSSDDAGSINELSSIRIIYTRLPKITNAKFAPVLARDSMESIFQVGPIKIVLEENLRLHSTLSVGDFVSVWHRGRKYQLNVVELQPESSGSLFNADVEVEFVSPEQQQTLSQTLSQMPSSTTTSSSSSNSNGNGAGGISSGGYRLSDSSTSSNPSSVIVPTSTLTTSLISNTNNNNNNNNIEAETYNLTPEPDATVNENDVVQMRVRLPHGTPLTRRFLRSQLLVDLFHFIFQNCSSSLKITNPAQLQVTLPSKNRTLTWEQVNSSINNNNNNNNSSEVLTFESVGLIKREMAIVSVYN